MRNCIFRNIVLTSFSNDLYSYVFEYKYFEIMHMTQLDLQDMRHFL